MLVESADDLVMAMNWQQSDVKRTAQLPLFTELTDEEKKAVDCLKDGPVHLDELAYAMGQSVSRVSVSLLGLEFKGIVQSAPGKMFRLAR